MYVCGSTVYQRVHVGNARPFVLAMWLRSWLRRTGYDVTLVHNITDVDDKVYVEAAAREVASRDLAAWATGWFVEDTDGLGLGRPDVEPRASETMPEIIAFIEELARARSRVRGRAETCTSVSRASRTTGALSGAKPDEMVAQEPNELKEDPRDFALWKAQKPGEDAAWDSPWGPGRPGLAHRVLCDGREAPRPGVRDPRRGATTCVFPHHENERAQSCSLGHPFAQIWMHNGMLELDAEKMSKSLGNVVTLQNVLDTWGRETLLVYLLTAHWRKPVDFSDDVLEQAAAQAEAFRNVFRSPSEPAADGAWERFAAALDDDFSTPEALAVMHEWRDHELLARALDVFGLASLAEQAEAPAEAVALAEEREAARALRRLRGRPTGCAARSRRSAGRCATWPDGFQLVRRAMTPRARLRPPAGVRGAAWPAWRARAPCERAGAALGDVASRRALRRACRSQPSASSRSSQARATTRASSPSASPTGTPTRTSWRVQPQPLLVCLDGVTDPHNLGAVCRSAEGAGATGLVLPAHRSARVTPAVCRASAGAVEHLPVAVVPNLARFVADVKGPELWAYAAVAEAPTPLWEADFEGGVAARARRRGQGHPSARSPSVRRRDRDPARRQASSRSTSAWRRRSSCSRRTPESRSAHA